MHLNVYSIRFLESFFKKIREHAFVLCFTEHHLTHNTIAEYPFPADYKMVTHCCRTIHRYGGIVIYVLRFTDITELIPKTTQSEADCEFCVFYQLALVWVYPCLSENFNILITG